MITTVNCGLSLQLTCQLINLSTKNYELRELHESLSLIRDIRVIRSFLVYDFVAIMIRGIRVIRSPNLFYISGQEKVRNGVENQLFCYLCKYFVIR